MNMNKAKIGHIVFSVLATVIILIPIVIMFSVSLMGKGIQDYIEVFTVNSVGRYFLNSTIISVSSVTLVALVVLMGAFAFSKLRFRGKGFLYTFCLAALMLPSAAILVPVFQMSKALGMLGTHAMVIGPVVAFSAPFNLLIAKNYYDNLPNALLEAAMIDGCTLTKLMRHIVIPLSKPMLMIVIVWSFLNSWNEYLFPLVFLRKQEMMTVTIIPSLFQQQYGGNVPKLFASLVIIAAPVMLVYFCLQKYIVAGLTEGAVKG